MLPFMAKHVKKLTTEGLEFNHQQAVVNEPEPGLPLAREGQPGDAQPDSEPLSTVSTDFAEDIDMPTASSDPWRLTVSGWLILKTLYTFQRREFPDDDNKRWGFKVGEGAPDFDYFAFWTTELILKGLVKFDAKEFAYLTNEWLAFCKRYLQTLNRVPLYYKNSQQGFLF